MLADIQKVGLNPENYLISRVVVLFIVALVGLVSPLRLKILREFLGSGHVVRRREIYWRWADESDLVDLVAYLGRKIQERRPLPWATARGSHHVF